MDYSELVSVHHAKESLDFIILHVIIPLFHNLFVEMSLSPSLKFLITLMLQIT